MGRLEKLTQKLEAGPSEARFSDIHWLLERAGFRHVNTKGDHFSYVHPSDETQVLIVVADKGRKVRRWYYKEVLKRVKPFLDERDDDAQQRES